MTSITGRTGTLHFAETLTAVGSPEPMHIDGSSAAGTGGFHGSGATLAFDGHDNIATGSGTCAGQWRQRRVR
jgi:hypothetical protein